ncbi:MAG: TraB/GumN family protein [Planctomycetota bacterium]
MRTFTPSPSRRALLALTALVLAFAAPRRGAAQEPESAARPTSAAPAVQVPFLYELQGHGATAYLLGTVHLPDPRVLKLPEVVERAFAAADAVYTEIPATPAAELQIFGASRLPKEESLASIIGEPLMKRLHARLAGARLPVGLFDSFRPWAVASTLPLLDILADISTTEPLDKALYNRAVKEGKRVGALETVAEQIAVFDGLEQSEQVTMLREAIDQLERYEAQERNALEELIQAWLSGDLARLVALLEEGLGADEALAQKLEQRLVWSRNALMAARMHDAIVAKPTEVLFFAVGALHLPDARKTEDTSEEEQLRMRGLLSLLRERGYVVTHRRALEGAPLSTR